MILRPYNELIGDLIEVRIKDGKIKFLFSINEEIEVPQSAFAETDFKKYIGSRVGVFNDGQNYQIRKISPSYKNKKHEEGD